ncbi:MAG: MauE/DoxX family redox-associated membrane protein [Actinomycetota bacterium]
MVETITPVVDGGRARWLETLALHTLGATATAALFGATLGWIGELLGAPWQRAGMVALTTVAGVYAMSELTHRRIPVPQLRRQVPDWWRSFFGRSFAAVLYGAGLGVGFFTYLAHGTLVVVASVAVVSGRPTIGALLVAPFGLARGLSVAVAWRSVSAEQSSALVDRLVAAPESRRRAANGGVLALLAGTAAVAVVDSPNGGWFALAASALAAAFAWAAVSKIVGRRRWRLALHSHGLPATIETFVALAVPVCEAIVPVLVLIGLPRAAGVWTLIMLLPFSMELVRLRRQGSGRVACGCFGSRDTVGVREALARNAGLALIAMLVVARATDRSVVAWPPAPRPADVVPLLLALGALSVAGLTIWRTWVWLTHGRQT